MLAFTPHLLCTLLLSALLWADAATPRFSECTPQEIPNMVIDVPNSVAKGARFTDPVKAASVEECVSACCLMLNSTGDRTCNLAVYDTRSGNGVQNCYLFLCREPKSCVMIPSPGVLSYSFWTEKEEGNPDSKEEDLVKSMNNGKVQNSLDNELGTTVKATVSAQPEFEEELNQHNSVKNSSPLGAHSQSKTSEVKHVSKEDKAKANTPNDITSRLLHLANNMDKHLEKIQANSKEAKDSESVELSVLLTDKNSVVEPTGAKHKDPNKLSSDTDTKSSDVIKKKPKTLEVYYPTPELRTSTPSVRTSHQISTTAHRPIQNRKTTVLPSTSKERKVANKEPNSGTKSSKVLSSHNNDNSSSPADTVKHMNSGHLVISTQVPTTITILEVKSALPVTPHNPSRTSLLKTVKSTLKDGGHYFTSKDVQEAEGSVPGAIAPEQQDPSSRGSKDLDTIPSNTDKSGLVAALVFGVVFLVLIIGLVSHKVSEARRRHQYTKLDYLINGMYVDT